jgi:hypothetical protein
MYMDIAEKAYDYIDYTLEELCKLESHCVSLLYFFKLFSPAGQLANDLLVRNEFISINEGRLVAITDKGKSVLRMGGIREYLQKMDRQEMIRRAGLKKVKKIVQWTAGAAATILVFALVRKKSLNSPESRLN